MVDRLVKKGSTKQEAETMIASRRTDFNKANRSSRRSHTKIPSGDRRNKTRTTSTSIQAETNVIIKVASLNLCHGLPSKKFTQSINR